MYVRREKDVRPIAKGITLESCAVVSIAILLAYLIKKRQRRFDEENKEFMLLKILNNKELSEIEIENAIDEVQKRFTLLKRHRGTAKTQQIKVDKTPLLQDEEPEKDIDH